MPIPLVTQILIADDFPIVREGLKKVLDAQPDLEVVAEAERRRRGHRRRRSPRMLTSSSSTSRCPG